MTHKNVFDFDDYKAFIIAIEQDRKLFQKGFRTKLAEHLNCQSGYISHVLNNEAHFSLEQTMRIANFLNLVQREQKYLLLLVEHARAGTTELQNHFENELRSLKEEHLNIKERVGASLTLSDADQSIYYSSWHYAAVHVLSSLKNYNDAKSIAHVLKIPEEVVGRVLLFLVQSQLIEQGKGVLKPGVTQVHLNRESPLIRQHHTNWRIAAIQSLMNDDRTDLHYSTLSTLSKADAEKIRAEMVKLIENYVEIVKPSNEEVLYGFNLDFYGLISK